MTTFFVPGVPAPQGSKTAYVVNKHTNPRAVLTEASKKVKPWRKDVTNIARMYCAEPIDGPVQVFLHFVMPRTKAMGNKQAPPMVQKPDLDKLTRAVLDGLTGVVFKDDSQVVALEAAKRRAKPGEETGVHLVVLPMSEKVSA